MTSRQPQKIMTVAAMLDQPSASRRKNSQPVNSVNAGVVAPPDDRTNGVVNKLRIMTVFLGILDDHRLLRNQVVQVMHQECGQPIVSPELTGFRKATIRLGLVDVGSNMTPDRFQQVVVLKVKRRHDPRSG